MKILIVFVISISILISSCSSTHHLLYCMAISEKAESENAIIKLKSGEEVEGKIIEISVDSTFNEILLSKEESIIPASQVTEIHLKDRTTGALEFAGICLLLGLVTEGIVAITESDYRARGITMVIIVPLVTLRTSVLSMIPGAIIGHKDIYIFSESLPNEYIKVKMEK